MSKKVFLYFSDLFGIAFLSGWLSGASAFLSIIVWLQIISGFSVSNVTLGIIVGLASSIIFQPVFLVTLMIYNYFIFGNEKFDKLDIHRLIFPFSGAIVAFLFSLSAMDPSVQTSSVFMFAGLFGGSGCSFFWGYVKSHRAANPIDQKSNGKILFLPTWMGRS